MPTATIGVRWDIEVDVTLEDGTTHRVGPFGPRELIAAERQFGIPSDLIRQMPRTEHLAFVAWHQLQRRGVLHDTTFDAFVDRLADMTAQAEVAEDEPVEDEEPGPAMAPSPNGSP